MTRKREVISEVEQLRQVERQATSPHPVTRSRRIVGIERAEQRLFVPVAPSSTLLAGEESFITDWADS
jgi:hypothetical protein